MEIGREMELEGKGVKERNGDGEVDEDGKEW
jgi:hypothetical protein